MELTLCRLVLSFLGVSGDVNFVSDCVCRTTARYSAPHPPAKKGGEAVPRREGGALRTQHSCSGKAHEGKSPAHGHVSRALGQRP